MLKRILLALAMLSAVSIGTAVVWTLTSQPAVAGCSSGC
jgi:hypothetical protein